LDDWQAQIDLYMKVLTSGGTHMFGTLKQMDLPSPDALLYMTADQLTQIDQMRRALRLWANPFEAACGCVREEGESDRYILEVQLRLVASRGDMAELAVSDLLKPFSQVPVTFAFRDHASLELISRSKSVCNVLQERTTVLTVPETATDKLRVDIVTDFGTKAMLFFDKADLPKVG